MRVFTTILIIILIAIILYLLVRLNELHQQDKRKERHMVTRPLIKKPTEPIASTVGGARLAARNDTWEGIRGKLLSEDPSNWRLGIIEADIYMDRLLDDKGFHGDTTSDKLKQVTAADLASVQIAWEAHKVRNRIAHEGAAFALTQPEARKVLSFFEIVFRDLGAIS